MRKPIAHFDVTDTYGKAYGGALQLKKDLQEKFPEKVLQIRKRSKSFVLVERTYPGNQTQETPSKRRRRKRGFFVEPDLQSYR